MEHKMYFLMTVVLLALGGFFFWQAIKCKEPDKLTIALMQLDCAQKINVDVIVEKACLKIYDTPTCVFKPEDGLIIDDLLKKTIDKCVLDTLEDTKMCTESYEGMK